MHKRRHDTQEQAGQAWLSGDELDGSGLFCPGSRPRKRFLQPEKTQSQPIQPVGGIFAK